MVKYFNDFFSAWGAMKKKYPGRLERVTRKSIHHGYSMRIELDNRTIIRAKELTEKELYEKMTMRINYWLKFH